MAWKFQIHPLSLADCTALPNDEILQGWFILETWHSVCKAAKKIVLLILTLAKDSIGRRATISRLDQAWTGCGLVGWRAP